MAYSKKQANRSARYLRDVDFTALHEPEDWDGVRAAIDVVDWWRARHAKPLARVNANLRYYVRRAGAGERNVTQRLKRFGTIVDKLSRHPNMALTTMEDIGGVRAILESQHQVDHVVKALGAQPKWDVRRVREYVDDRDPGPKDDGYRAVHVIVLKDGCFVEIQLRTPWQDAWAQSVEQDTRRLKAGLKFGTGPTDLRNYYAMIAEYFAMRERLEEPDQEFLVELAKMFAATRRYFPTEQQDR